jgi:hypothetical protein
MSIEEKPEGPEDEGRLGEAVSDESEEPDFGEPEDKGEMGSLETLAAQLGQRVEVRDLEEISDQTVRVPLVVYHAGERIVVGMSEVHPDGTMCATFSEDANVFAKQVMRQVVGEFKFGIPQATPKDRVAQWMAEHPGLAATLIHKVKTEPPHLIENMKIYPREKLQELPEETEVFYDEGGPKPLLPYENGYRVLTRLELEAQDKAFTEQVARMSFGADPQELPEGTKVFYDELETLPGPEFPSVESAGSEVAKYWQDEMSRIRWGTEPDQPTNLMPLDDNVNYRQLTKLEIEKAAKSLTEYEHRTPEERFGSPED